MFARIRTKGRKKLAPIGRVRRNLRNEQGWKRGGYASPVPTRVKQAVLKRHHISGGTWVETGTWMGDTTDFLSGIADHVWSIEPGPELAARARERFLDRDNVTIVEGLSEDHLGHILESLHGDVCLWLDGHYSAGDTFQGPMDTPITMELREVERHLPRLDHVTVLVDDVRCFDPSLPEYATYPSRDWLVEWATSQGLSWTIEHDIFVATTKLN